MGKTLKKNSNLVMCIAELIIGILLLINPVGFTRGIIVALGIPLTLQGIGSVVSYIREKPQAAAEGMPHVKVKSDYLLMLTQCILGLAVMLLPSLINHRWSVPIPRKIYIAYYVFLFCAIFLGEVFDFYYVIPHWDIILHAFSGAMLSALGFIMVDLLNSNQRVSVHALLNV